MTVNPMSFPVPLSKRFIIVNEKFPIMKRNVSSEDEMTNNCLKIVIILTIFRAKFIIQLKKLTKGAFYG